MRRSKADVDRYISSVQSSSPSVKEKPLKGFLFAKLYFEAKEYELAKRHVSAYLSVQERDPKAHKFLGQLYELDGDVNKAVGCYKRSVDLNPAQRDLVLKVAELLCNKDEQDSRAEFWVEKASKLMPGSPAVFKLKEKLLSRRGQQGWNQLFDLLQSELQLRPGDAHVNVKLVELYCSDGRLEEAVKHCLSVEKAGVLCNSLDWYTTVVCTLQDYLSQPSASINDKSCRKYQKELLLAHCNQLRCTLPEKGVAQCAEALQNFDHAMQSLKNTAPNTTDELAEMFTELKGHLYLYAGTLLLKMALEREQQWRAVVDLAALCYLLAYQVPRPKIKSSKGDHPPQHPLELLACDRQSQAGHMLLNLSQDVDQLVKDVVEAFGNRSGQGTLFDMLFGADAPASLSFIGNDDIRSISAQAPEIADLIKADNGSILLCGGDLQRLTWLGLQWSFMAQRPALREWLKQLFPRLNLETSKLDTNTPESICLLDLEVFLCGVVFTSHTQLLETAKIAASSQLHEPRCLPLQVMKLLSTTRQREWWDAVYTLIHKKAQPGTSAKLRMVVQHGLSTLRAGEKHGLQPALLVHWAQHLSETGVGVNSYYDQKDYTGRSVHYWKVALTLLEKIKKRRGIPEPLDPLFLHFPSRDIQVSEVKGYEEEAMIAFATFLDIEGKTEEAIATLEGINTISSNWQLARIFQRLSEEAGNGVEETQDRCMTFLKKFRKHLMKIYNANATEVDKLPVSMEEVMDLLEEVNQQLGENGDVMDEDESRPFHSSPHQLSEPAAASSQIKFSPSPSKNISSPSRRTMFSPKTPPHWAEDQKSLLQMLCQTVEALKNEVHDLRLNSSDTAASPHHRVYGEGYNSETLQESFPAAQTFHGAPLTVATTAPNVYYNQSPAYNTQFLLRPAANVTPTKAPVYGINRLPPQQHMYAYQPPTHTPPLQTTPACVYPQDFGAPLRFESPATSLLSPYSEEYYNHSVPPPTTNPPLPEPGYFTKPSVVPAKTSEGKTLDFGKINFGQPADPSKVPAFGTQSASTATPAAFKFNSNFKSNDGDFTFSSGQVKNSESLLGLLTADMPRNDGQSESKPTTQDQTQSQSGVFTFGSQSAAGFSFADAAAQNKTGFFGKPEQTFGFPELGKSVTVEQEDKAGESDNDSTHVEEDEDGPHFEPIVPLPDKVDVKTGEEEEEEMFCNRAKLFRFDTEAKEWKERGIGSLKILKHKTSGKVRLLMRREQVLKICANHYITADMVLKPNAGSDKSWVWYAMDYADEMPRTEQLAIRFKTSDEAALFKVKFEEAQKVLPKSPQKQDQPDGSKVEEMAPAKRPDLKAQFAKKDGEWDCDVCCVRNASAAKHCVACQTPNPNCAKTEEPSEEPKGFPPVSTSAGGFTFGITGEAAKDTSTLSKGFSSFGSQIPVSFKFGTSSSSTSASISDPSMATSTTSFGTDFGANTTNKTTADASTKSSFSFGTGFGAQFARKEGEWDCPTCCVRNAASSSSCASCQTQNPSCKVDEGPPKASSFGFGTGFGAQFAKKEGEWDCPTCCVRNPVSASSCASCQTQNPSCKVDEGPPKASSFGFGTGFGAQFAKKEGEWDCPTCCVRNPVSASSCASCQTQNPSCKVDEGPPKASSFGFGTGFGAQFAKKEGEWDCPTCCVRNPVSASSCASCQTQNPSCKVEEGPPKASSFGFGTGFGAQFAKKEGEWDCPTCCVRNLASSRSCASCQTPNPSSKCDEGASKASSTVSGFGSQFVKKDGQWDCDQCLVRNEPTASKCVSCQAPNPVQPSQGGLAVMFGKKDGQWDCDTCLVRNDGSASQCVSCQTPNPSAKHSTTSGPSSSSLGFNPGVPTKFGQPTGTGFTGRSPFQFGPSKESSTPSSAGFSFSIPTGGFKFGSQEPANETKATESDPASVGSASMFLKNIAEQHREKEEIATSTLTSSVEKSELDDNPLFHPKPNSFSFADLAKSKEGFQFGQEDPSFKGFKGAGEQLFTVPQSNQKEDAPVDQDDEDMYKTDENDDIQFEPVVQMPDKVELVTGEEDEEVLYCQRVKLFRFDNELSQWKERGVGNLKLLRNSVNGRLRVLMRREQVLKVCANHWITTTMNLKPLAGSDRAWMWLANDFADGDAKLEQLAAKFKTPELSEDFKLKFDDCQKLLLNIPLQTPHKLVDTGRTAHLIQKAEEMKSGLKDLKSFLTDDKKIKDDECKDVTSTSNASGLFSKPHAETTGPTLEWDNYDLREEALDDTADTSVYASPLASSPIRKNLFRFGESTDGFNFSFQPVLSPAKSPAKVNQSRVSVGTDDEQDTTQEEERDGQYFEPVVPLPDLVEISTGEENELVVFSHRAKLYRYDKDLNQWKERGIGDLKILQNYDTKRVRLIMRRDQVLKLCANHWITSIMNLEPMKGADEKAWIWSAFDFTEGEGKVEQLAVRFKLQDTAKAFKEIFDEAKVAQEKDILVTPASSREGPSQETICGKAAIAVLEETTRERTDLSPETFHTPENKTATSPSPTGVSKTVVSPPKFVFGTDSVQKIFGSPPAKDASPTQPKEKAPGTSASSQPAIPAFKVPEGGLDFRLFKDNPMAFWTSTSSTQFEPQGILSLHCCVCCDSSPNEQSPSGHCSQLTWLYGVETCIFFLQGLNLTCCMSIISNLADY
ncbi:ranBP2-like and GRIP domain-containing protein 3 isoform X2 [Sardina pilchardus]|uniref:ranBP2-like and GRIP domain-containing protein 3 isoform X2 n=1 Tax=Sardina pilchardus TaxID=27697 RepID=UPI002E10D422